ncbi:MAG: PA2778 family cysteine peptidase [Candidatus Tectomicrobia bacterium]|nr:PA2778 family cysteine peptidase [Candidatus Tectomicrobia bacterium]
MKFPAFSTGLLLVLSLSGCATPQTDQLLAEGHSTAISRAEITDVPFYPQEKFYCGPAALAMALGWSGVPVRPGELVSLMYTPERKGTLQTEILTAARRRGRVAYPVSSLADLLREVAAGHPVVVLQNLGLSWYPRWHYSVVVGYDLPRGEVILHSGLEARAPMPMRLFERTWARGNNRWPRSLGALMGLGNSRYALGDLPGAEEVFRAAIHFHPEAAPAYNNLAQVLAETGRRREALLHAEEAITLGGPMMPFFLKTREKIQASGGAPQDEDLPVLEKHM